MHSRANQLTNMVALEIPDGRLTQGILQPLCEHSRLLRLQLPQAEAVSGDVDAPRPDVADILANVSTALTQLTALVFQVRASFPCLRVLFLLF